MRIMISIRFTIQSAIPTAERVKFLTIWTPPLHSNASLCVSTREAYWPFWPNSSKWVPSSSILPSEHSAIWCAFWTVLKRWAITNVVLPFISRFRASWTSLSLAASKALVAWWWDQRLCQLKNLILIQLRQKKDMLPRQVSILERSWAEPWLWRFFGVAHHSADHHVHQPVCRSPSNSWFFSVAIYIYILHFRLMH